MKLKEEFFDVIFDLGHWSTEMCLLTDWSKDGITQADFEHFVDATSRFVRVVLKNKPKDLFDND